MALPSTPKHPWENAVSTALTTYDLPLNCLRRAFDTLMNAPRPLSLDGGEIGAGLPDRTLELREIKALLMTRRTAATAKRALWAAVVDRSQAGQAQWTTVAAGLAYPALVSSFNLACKNTPGDWQELQAELVAEFLVALAEIDVADPRIKDVAGCLSSRALSASWKARTADECGIKTATAPGAVMPLFPAGHPDIVLARAVRAGVLTETESDIIGRLYLEDQRVEDVAAALSIPLSTFYRRRNAAVQRLAEAIEDGILRPF
jgi:hypothetical protein